jgi:aryl-alcohol dehydrogenase-like predicted oxidoreductase
MQPVCVENKISVIGYYSLASGFLTGKYRSADDVGKSARGAGIQQKYMNERGFRILKALDQVADKHGSKPGSIALAWLLTRPAVAAPIASATNLDQLHDLTRAVHVKLDQKDIELLDQASLP